MTGVRWRRLVVGVVVAVGVLGCLLAGTALVAVRADLASARAAGQQGRIALTAGDAQTARRAFHESSRRFADASHRTREALFRVAAAVPVVGANVRTVRALADAGGEVAKAGEAVAAGLVELSRGATAASDGHIPIEAIAAMQPSLRSAERRIVAADALLRSTPAAPLLGPVAGARRELQAVLDQLLPGVRSAEALSRQLPPLLGADGSRRYFFGASTPAEARGSGGFIGAYAILTVREGRLRFSRFGATSDLPTVPAGRIDAPNPDYAARYDEYGGAGFWLNINMTPDFPSAATAIESLYAHVDDQRLDGTIVADPYALQSLLRFTGPAEVPQVGQVDADNVVPFMTNEAYSQFADPDERKAILGAVSAGVLQRFLQRSGGDDPLAAIRALGAAARDGHLLVHSAEPAVQRALVTAGVSGRLRDPDGDYFSLVTNNAAGNKIDYYAQRRMRYRAVLAEDGTVLSHAAVRLRNAAPRSGQPAYVIGPTIESLQAGENASLVSVYGPGGALLEEFGVDGQRELVNAQRELGHPVWTKSVRLRSGEAVDLSYEWRLADGWIGDVDGGRYRLTVQGQTTVRPTRLDLAIDLPQGLRPIRMTDGLQFRGSRVTYSGSLDDDMVFEVSFARPTIERWWGVVRRFLRQPLF